MDMKRHMLIFFFRCMLVDREKQWNSYKIKVVIKKGERKLLKNKLSN
jgi:hypothetical protein